MGVLLFQRVVVVNGFRAESWLLEIGSGLNIAEHFGNIDFFDVWLESGVDEDSDPFDHFVELAGGEGLNDGREFKEVAKLA